MMTWHEGRFLLRKSNGLVRDVFHTRHMTRLRGNVGIGHVRYPTAGSASEAIVISRLAPIPPKLVLTRYRAKTCAPSLYLFPGNNGRPHVSATTVWTWVTDVGRLAGVEVSPQRLRSTAGAEALEATKDLDAVAELLGHRDVNVTRAHYTRTTRRRLRAAVEALAPLFTTPRSAKRFINIYRLMRVSLQDTELNALEGTTVSPGEYRTALLLLALVTNYPRLAPHVLADSENVPYPARHEPGRARHR